MAQETIVDFSVIKQKIIKTDEVLRMYQEATNKLKKVQQAYKEIKLNYDQTVFNLNRLQLENERCTFNFQNMKSHQDKRELENKELREQIALLEDKYNRQAIQSQLEIKKLEDELKVLQDVKITSTIKCKKKQFHGTEEESDKKVKSLEGKIKEFKDMQTNYKQEIKELNEKNEKLTSTLFSSNQQYSETIKRLESEKRCLLDKIDKPNYQDEGQTSIVKNNCDHNTQIANLNQEKDKEINELRKKICRLTLDKSKLKTVAEENEKLKQQLMDQEMTLFNTSEEKSDVYTQTDILPKNQTPIHGQIMDTIETHKLEEPPPIDTQTLNRLNTEAQQEEIIKLKQKISGLIIDNNKLKNIKDKNEKLNQLLMKQEKSIFDAKENIRDFCIQTDVLPKNKKISVHVQTLDSMKAYKSQEKLHMENHTLKQLVSDYEGEIINLRTKLKLSHKEYNTKAVQTDQSDLDVEFLEDILEEMCVPIPKMLSPMSPALSENLEVERAPTPISDTINSCLTPISTVIPDIIVTPPTPTIEAVSDFQNNRTSSVLSKEKNVSSQNTIDSTSKDNLRNSRKSDNKMPYFKKIPKRRKYRSPCINNDFVRLKDYFSQSYLLNKRMFKREIRKVRKHKNQDCILKALQTLKRSKINFTISNESTLPNCWSNNGWLNDYQLANSNIYLPQVNPTKSTGFTSTPKFKNRKYLTEKLNCTFQSCNKDNCYMLVNKRNNATELLGFFSVKDEIITPSCSRVDNILGNKPFDFIRINPTLSDTIELTSGGLETLADLVSKKLKQMENIIPDNNCDSFNSETETEIEMLFEKPAYILKRNEILLKKAQHSLSASSFEKRETRRRQVEDTCTKSIGTVPSDLSYETEETSNHDRSTTVAPCEHMLQNINENVFVSKDFEGETEESCDSQKFSDCPELISPLSTISKGFSTPPSKLTTVWLVKDSEEHDVRLNENSAYSPVSNITEVNALTKQTEKNGVNDSFQNEENLENEKNQIWSGLKQSFEDLSSNSCLYITPLNSTDNGNCLNDSSTSITINTYLCDEKALSKDVNTLVINFEGGECLIEDNREIEDAQIRANESSSVLHLRSLLNAGKSPVKLISRFKKPEGKITTLDDVSTGFLQNDKFKGNVSSEFDSVSLEDKLQIQKIKSPEIERAKATKNLFFPGMNMPTEQLFNYNIIENEKSVKENIISSDIVEDRFKMAEDNEETCSLRKDEVKTLPSCPTSPVHEGFEDLIHPIIIPLEKLNDKDAAYCPTNTTRNIPNFTKSLNHEDLEVGSTVKNQKDFSEVLPGVINLSNNIVYNNTRKTNLNKYDGDCTDSGSGFISLSGSKEELNQDEKQKEPVNIIGQNSPRKISNVPEINEKLIAAKAIENLVRKEMDLDSFDVNDLDKKHTISCPQSPINDYRHEVDFTVPKIIPLEKVEHVEDISTLPFSTEYPSMQRTKEHNINARESTSITSLDSGKYQSFICGNIEPSIDIISSVNEETKFTRSGRDIMRDIFDVLPNEEIENDCIVISSCPQSPINDYNKTDYTYPKIIPLDRSNVSDTFSIQCTSFVNEESVESQNNLLKVDSSHTNNNNSATTLHRNSTSSMVLRSKRNLKRNKDVLDESPTDDDSNREERASTLKSENIDPSTIKRLKMSGATLPSNGLNIPSEIIMPVKRKRGRPRKQPVEQQIKSLIFDDIRHTEDISVYQNLDSSQKLTSEEKDNISELSTEQSLQTAHEVPAEENFELTNNTGPNKNNILADLSASKSSDSDPDGTVCQNNSLPILTKNNLDELENKNKKKETVCRNRVVKRRPITKLKSNILKQFKEKRKMFQTNVEIGNLVNNSSACDTKSNNLSESNIDIKQTNICVDIEKKVNGTSLVVGSMSHINDTKQKYNRKKIHVVQNILIPPNSNYTVDLLERREHASNCDISLDDNSSQTSINIDNFAFQESNKSVNTNIDNIPVKTKRRNKKKNEHKKSDVNRGNDILSQIIEEMDKNKKIKVLSDAETKISKPKENLPASINDGHWRKSILEIAECTHNISTTEKDIIIMASRKKGLLKNPRDPPSKKVKILMSRLIQRSSDEKIADEIILEFKRQSMDAIADIIAVLAVTDSSSRIYSKNQAILDTLCLLELICNIILQKVSQDCVDKAEEKYCSAPLMTVTQRILLNLMMRLECENVDNLMDTFLTKAELFLFHIGCGIRTMVPVTRLYMAVCRLRANVNRMRAFCLNAFLSMGDMAIPLLFIVLTSWTDILPMESNVKLYPLTKVLVHVVHLKDCNKPGYNLLSLRQLLNQFYGYPRERWNCDEVFEELFQQYLRNPVKSIDIGVRILCKNKDTKWVYKKINEFLKPLIYKIPAENVNFKATAIILIGNICKQFKPEKELDETYLNDVRRWLIGLTEGDKVSDIVERSVDLSLSMLPKKKLKAKNRKKKKRIVNIITNKKNKKKLKRLKKKVMGY